MKGFIMLEMPKKIKIAVPIENDGQICAFTLKNMRDRAWGIVADMEYEEGRRDA
tara:strand:+ start:207 stop:368 length:162 start_codon:yes stop_codon:yes gene_type:complete